MVVPLYNERAALDELYERLSAVLLDVAPTYEIIFVDDGSTDGSLARLKEFRASNRSVRYIRFSGTSANQPRWLPDSALPATE